MLINNWVVSVVCSTYNQSRYIKNTFEGFCMQNTNFPFVCVIMDDCSTDGEQSVIKDYLAKDFDLIDSPEFVAPETDDYTFVFAKHKVNQNCFFAVYCLKYNHFGKKNKRPYYEGWLKRTKYIAYCEGDDFWIDSEKIQKQFDILESDSTIQLVYTGFNCVDADGNRTIRPDREELMKMSKSGDIFFELLQRNFVMTLTTCYRSEFILSSFVKKAPKSQDYLYSLLASALGNVVYIPQKTACYRNSPNGAMNTRAKQVWEINQYIRFYVLKLYFKGAFQKREPQINRKIFFLMINKRIKFLWYLVKQRIKRLIKIKT